jgi:hypothetical protein
MVGKPKGLDFEITQNRTKPQNLRKVTRNYSARLYGTSFPHVFSGNPAFVTSMDAQMYLLGLTAE